MTIHELSLLYDEFWDVKKVRLNRAGQRRVWGLLVEVLPRAVVLEAFTEWAATQTFPPQAGQIRPVLNRYMERWVAENPNTAEAMRWTGGQTDKPPVSRPCGTCGARLRFDADTGERFSCDGGRVYREVHGTWYSARCFACGGRVPDRKMGLPRPSPGQEREWVPLRRTPGWPLYRKLGMDLRALLRGGKLCEYLAWEKAAAQASMDYLVMADDPDPAHTACVAALGGE